MSDRDEAAAKKPRPPRAEDPRAAASRGWPVKESGVLERQDRVLREAFGEGDAALARGDIDAAAARYVAAIDRLRQAPLATQAEAYLRLGRANRLRGRAAAAVHCLKKALVMAPRHLAALAELVALHAAWSDWDAMALAEDELLRAIDDPEAQLRELLRSGDRWWRRAGDPVRAEARYHAALALDRGHEATHARLRALADSRRRAEAFDRLRDEAARAPDAPERARRWLALGRAQVEEAQRPADAIASFENAYLADPTQLEAMERLVAVLIEHRQWSRLEAWWGRLADAKTDATIAARAILREALRHVPADRPRPRRSTLPWFDRDD